ATPSELQAGIDRDLKPQSRALPETQVTLHYRNSSVTTGRTYNLAGLLEGSDPKLKAETILFSGHHDHDGISGDQIWHGADDNGLLGSFYMAAHSLRPLETTRAVVNFDMIGRNETESDQTKGLVEIPAYTTNRLNLIGASYSPDYDRTVVQENKYVGLDLDYRFDREYALNIFFRSDQFPFVLHNIPSFWWFTGFHPDYHHTTDTADKIN